MLNLRHKRAYLEIIYFPGFEIFPLPQKEYLSGNGWANDFDAAASEIGADEFSHLLVEPAQEDGANGERHVVTESAQKPGALERHVRGAHHQRASRWIRQRK